MNQKIGVSILTFVKFLIYSTLVNLSASMPAHDNPLFWKLLGASVVAALIKSIMTFISTEVKPNVMAQ
jgi:hypothetical protein